MPCVIFLTDYYQPVQTTKMIFVSLLFEEVRLVLQGILTRHNFQINIFHLAYLCTKLNFVNKGFA